MAVGAEVAGRHLAIEQAGLVAAQALGEEAPEGGQFFAGRAGRHQPGHRAGRLQASGDDSQGFVPGGT